MTKNEEIIRLERFAEEFPEDSYSRPALLDFVRLAKRSIQVDHFVPEYSGLVDAADRMVRDASKEAECVLADAKARTDRMAGERLENLRKSVVASVDRWLCE